MEITNRLGFFFQTNLIGKERERKREGRRATKPHPSNGDRRRVQRSERSSPLVLPQQTKRSQIEVVNVISGLLLSNRRRNFTQYEECRMVLRDSHCELVDFSTSHNHLVYMETHGSRGASQRFERGEATNEEVSKSLEAEKRKRHLIHKAR